ncbi:hypothetical protein GCM10010429_21190 [Micromonospora olivasterospora]
MADEYPEGEYEDRDAEGEYEESDRRQDLDEPADDETDRPRRRRKPVGQR